MGGVINNGRWIISQNKYNCHYANLRSSAIKFSYQSNKNKVRERKQHCFPLCEEHTKSVTVMLKENTSNFAPHFCPCHFNGWRELEYSWN